VFTEGNTIFVLEGDRVTIGAADEVTLLEIRADLMMPGR
jgi:hypothetical protein